MTTLTTDEKVEQRRRENAAEEAARLRAWQPAAAFAHLKAAELALGELYYEIDNNVAPWADLIGDIDFNALTEHDLKCARAALELTHVIVDRLTSAIAGLTVEYHRAAIAARTTFNAAFGVEQLAREITWYDRMKDDA